MIVIKNAEVYSPEYLGKKSLVIAGGKIEGIYDDIEIPSSFGDIEVLDAEGKFVFPGFIDSHVHIIGGGGEDGFKSRTPEIQLSELLEGGITTVVGCLGTDSVGRDMKTLLAKAYGLDEEGISTYLYTGSYQIPIRPITNSPDEDIILIQKIIGIGEIALSDHRSSQPSYDEFLKVLALARVAGLLSGKAGVVNAHIGNGKDGIKYLFKMLEDTDIPPRQVIPTHMNRKKELLYSGVKYCKLGGIIDLTTSSDPRFLEKDEVKASTGLRFVLDEGVDISHIQFTSDGQGSLPKFNEKGEFAGLGVGSVKSLYSEVRDAVLVEGVKLEEALKVITSNVSDNLRLSHKGRVKTGCDADIVMVESKNLDITDVVAKGRIMIKDNKVLVKGTFEK